MKHYRLVMCLCLAMLSASCSRQYTLSDKSLAEIHTDWLRWSDSLGLPSILQVFVYDAVTGDLAYATIFDEADCCLPLASGTYDLLVCPYYLSANYIGGESTAGGVRLDSEPWLSADGRTQAMDTTDECRVAWVLGVELGLSDQDNPLELSPEVMSTTRHYRLEVKGIKGLRYVLNAQASVPGFSRGRLLLADSLLADTITLDVPLRMAPDSLGLQADFQAWGRNAASPNRFTVEVELEPLSGIALQARCEAWLSGTESDSVYHIEVDGSALQVEAPQPSGGLDFEVEGWEEEIHNYIIE